MKGKKELIIYLIIFIIACLVFIPFLTGHIATDTYNIINMGVDKYAINYSLNDGRPVNCLILLLLYKIGVSIESMVIILTVLAIAVSCLTIMIIRKVIINIKEPKNIKEDILITVFSYVTVFNFSFLENMQYIECLVMTLSIMLYTLSAKEFVYEKKYIKSFLYTILATLCYQGTVGWLIVVTMVFSLLKEKRINKKLIKSVLIIGIYAGISIALNFLQIKIWNYITNTQQSRLDRMFDFATNIKYIKSKMLPTYIETFNLFPKYCFIALYTSIILITLIEERRKTVNLVLLSMLSILIIFVPNVFLIEGLGTARMCFTLGATLGIMLIYVYCNTEIFEKQSYFKWLVVVITLIYFTISICTYILIMLEQKKVNELDKQDVLTMEKYFKEYEEQNNQKLKNIVKVYDRSKTYFYDDKIKSKSSLCYRALSMPWSWLGCINYYTNRNLKEKFTDNEYTRELESKDWDKLNKDQFRFKEDTVYCCMY